MDRLWFKIGEAALMVGVTPKDLRYWERIIPEIRPRRSKGNLRYYHREDLPRLQRIHGWLQEGLTVSDCRQLLLTGQLARGLGLDEEAAARPEPRPRGSHRAARAATLPARRDLDLRPILEALRGLLESLT
jgi:DNA-binding transcriptional MerR regulator